MLTDDFGLGLICGVSITLIFAGILTGPDPIFAGAMAGGGAGIGMTVLAASTTGDDDG